MAWRWLFGRSGPGATNHFEAGGFLRSNDDVTYPNPMFHFLPLAVRYDGSAPIRGHGYQVHVGPMCSDARGSVLIRSAHVVLADADLEAAIDHALTAVLPHSGQVCSAGARLIVEAALHDEVVDEGVRPVRPAGGVGRVRPLGHRA